MFDFVFAVIAISLGGPSAPSDGVGRPDAPMTVQAPARPAAPASPAAPPAPAAPPPAFYMDAVPPGLVAEDQTPTGRFTTAAEVRPILNATRGNWIAVREYDGRDFLYVTHLWSWRCGLAAMAIAVNDAPMRNLPMPPCHDLSPAPNAILEGDPQPYLTFDLGSVERVRVQVVYDDLGMAIEGFVRGDVLIP
ncbi:hypothetical protein [Sulfitobacter faviae]|uniref:hypothetical protein n=1 Tax=Sulfitobacter faviae TaxID=1775881 RepID=UPI00398D5FE9